MEAIFLSIKKQFNVAKIKEQNLPIEIIETHCKKQTEKIWKDFDSVELLKDYKNM